MKKKSVVCLCTAFLLLAASSCGQSAEIPTETEATEAVTTTPETEAVSHYYDSLPEKDLGGMEFRIISRMMQEGHDVQSFTDYGNNEIDAKSLNGTQINDVVYHRNRELESRYNFVFNSIQPNVTPLATAKKSILAASDDYDAIVDGFNQMNDYSLFLCLDGLDALDLTAACWDQNVNTSLSVGGRHYIAEGDMLILDKKGTWCMLFNKKLSADLDLENLYDLVRAGKWTMDTFYNMAKKFSGDVNGDGAHDEADNWGFLTEDYNTNILMFAGETRLSEKNDEDYPVLTVYNEHTVSVFDKVCSIMSDTDVCLNMGRSKHGPEDCLKAFSEDRGLFYMTGIGTAMEYRYMDSDFGILPIPKYNEAQKSYYTSFSVGNSACIGIPKPAARTEEIGFILQAICLASTDTLKVTFYDTVLNGVTARDEESRDMLDIIFNNRVFDLAFIQNWGGIQSIYTSLVQRNNNDLASAYASKESKYQEKMEAAIEIYRNLE